MFLGFRLKAGQVSGGMPGPAYDMYDLSIQEGESILYGQADMGHLTSLMPSSKDSMKTVSPSELYTSTPPLKIILSAIILP